MLLQILTSKSSDRGLGLVPGTKGWLTQEMAKKLVCADWESNPLRECAHLIVRKLADAIMKPEHLISGKACQSISALAAVSMDDSVLEQWTNSVKQFAPSFREDIYNNLLQHVIDEFCPQSSRVQAMQR